MTAENIPRERGWLSGDIGICSIDIDGKDCWVWKALEIVSPVVVVTHIEFGTEKIKVPHDPEYRYPGSGLPWGSVAR